jgi:hypothetical protein
MKSVPNLISYLHEFFQNFSQSLTIYFELFSSGVNFNSEITDERAPPVRRRAPRWAHEAVRHCSVAATRRTSRQPRPDSAVVPLAASRPPRARHRRLAPRACLPTECRAAAPTATPFSRPPRSEATDVVRRHAACRSPIDVTLRRRPRASEPPIPRLSPVRHHRAAVGSPSSATAAHNVGRPSWAAHAGRASAAHTLCDWAERGFGPVAPGLNFIFSDLFNLLQIQKFV